MVKVSVFNAAIILWAWSLRSPIYIIPLYIPVFAPVSVSVTNIPAGSVMLVLIRTEVTSIVEGLPSIPDSSI